MDEKYGKIGIILIIILSTILVSGCIGSGETGTNNVSDNTPDKNTTSTDNQNDNDLVTITATDVHALQDGEPAKNDGFFAAIQSTDGKVYYIYQTDAIALGGDLSKSFKAKVSNGAAGLNSNANIIDDVYDMNGKALY